jgi:hypothetical protein
MGIARKGHDLKLIKAKDIKGVIIEGVGFGSEDERDAILGALTAKEMIRKKYDWVDLLEYEKEPIWADEPPIGYWMPKKFISEVQISNTEYSK